MKIVLDTSVLYQALYSSEGASHQILRLVRTGDLKMLISIPVFEEYCDVMLRPSSRESFGLDERDVQAVLDFIAMVGIKTDINYLLRPNLRDEGDNKFIELAFAGDARTVITKNVRDFLYNPALRFEDIRIVTPSDFLREWRTRYV